MRAMIIGFSLVLMGGTAAYADCADPQNQQEINQCVGADYREADEKLNRTYKELVGSIEDNWATALRDAQRAWVTFRDAECEFQSMGWEGGSGRSAVQAGCLTRVTNERTKVLKELLECDPENYEGALECPPKN